MASATENAVLGLVIGVVIARGLIVIASLLAPFLRYVSANIPWTRAGKRMLQSRFSPPRRWRDEEEKTKALEDSQLMYSNSLVAGAIALAAWTQLFVSSGNPPASRLSDFSLDLLFISALALLGHPLLFLARVSMSYLLRRTATAVGYTILVASMLAMTPAAFSPSMSGAIVITGITALSLREIVSFVHNCRLVWSSEEPDFGKMADPRPEY